MVDAPSEHGLSDWLDRLAAGTPAPGGGAVAALAAASAAALVAMTCRVTIGRSAHARSSHVMLETIAEADTLRASAQALIGADGAAYAQVIEAQKLARTTDGEQEARARAIDEALVGAAEVPLSTARHAIAIIELAERVRTDSNRNALADLEAGIIAARAALAISLLNARTNLAAMNDRRRGEALNGELAALEGWRGTIQQEPRR